MKDVYWLPPIPEGYKPSYTADEDYRVFVENTLIIDEERLLEERSGGIITAAELHPGEKVEALIRFIKRGEGPVLTIKDVIQTKQVKNPAILTDNPNFRSLGGGTLVRRIK